MLESYKGGDLYMTGVEIQYFLGIYFFVISLSWENGRISADTVRLIAGIVLLISAVLGLTLVR